MNVGSFVGAAVGINVGLCVGRIVGTAVGEDEGASVGDSVGVAVGNAVGEAVGCRRHHVHRPLMDRKSVHSSQWRHTLGQSLPLGSDPSKFSLEQNRSTQFKLDQGFGGVQSRCREQHPWATGVGDREGNSVGDCVGNADGDADG